MEQQHSPGGGRHPIGRRDLIALLGAAAVWRSEARADDERVRRMGMLWGTRETDAASQVNGAALAQGLAALGWRERGNLQTDRRWAATDPALFERYSAELVALRPDLLVSGGSSPAVAALLRQTHTIPIVFVNIVDPIGQGFVKSMARPGGNVTGFVNFEPSVSGKFLDLLKEVVPNINSVAMFFNPVSAPYYESYLGPFRAAAERLRIAAITAPVHSVAEIEAAMAAQANKPGGGLIAMPEAYSTEHRVEIAALAVRYRVPVVYPNRAFAEVGGLLSYGNDIPDNYRRAASYIDRILRGKNPADLPVQLPVKFELVLNLKTAKTLGLIIPPTLLARADEVIE